MGYWLDSTVEVEYNGKVTRLAKEDAHLYATKKTEKKQAKTEK